MKKQLALLSALLLLSACATEDTSICKIFGWCYTPKPKCKKVEIEQKEVVVDGYSLAKRSDRYETASYVISPQVYGILAARVTNDMLGAAPAIMDGKKNAKVYLAETKQIDRFLPGGPDAAGSAAKEIIEGSQMFDLVSDKGQADYVLEGVVNNINTPERPVIMYEMTMYDAQGNKIDSWSDSMRQVQNDDGSWW